MVVDRCTGGSEPVVGVGVERISVVGGWGGACVCWDCSWCFLGGFAEASSGCRLVAAVTPAGLLMARSFSPRAATHGVQHRAMHGRLSAA